LSDDLRLVLAQPEQRPLLDRLLQLYEYDFSEYGGLDVDEDGLFPTEDLDRTWRSGYDIFLLQVHDQTAGFAFVMRHEAYLGDGEVTLLDQFFVMRKYRRRGFGTRAATSLFGRYPGPWELATVRPNKAAQAFWPRVIGDYTGGAFQEQPDGCARWRGPIWSFRTP
jgi:predicted acetyltransferase